jgi:hypothetical protein
MQEFDVIDGDYMQGDVIFRLGSDDYITRAIVAHSPLPREKRRFSHAGIVVAQRAGAGDDDALVVHALPRVGVVLEKLRDFRAPRECRDFAAVRVLPADSAAAAARAAVRMQTMPFDDALSDADTAVYCTTLVARALRAGGLDVPRDLYRTRAIGYRHAMLHPDDLYVFLLKYAAA